MKKIAVKATNKNKKMKESEDSIFVGTFDWDYKELGVGFGDVPEDDFGAYDTCEVSPSNKYVVWSDDEDVEVCTWESFEADIHKGHEEITSQINNGESYVSTSYPAYAGVDFDLDDPKMNEFAEEFLNDPVAYTMDYINNSEADGDSSHGGIVFEMTPDGTVKVIAQGNTDISFYESDF